MGNPMIKSDEDVLVLDIRDPGPDQSFMDNLTKVEAHRIGLVDRIVVVDNTHTLVGNVYPTDTDSLSSTGGNRDQDE
jgi:hypothetical protein